MKKIFNNIFNNDYPGTDIIADNIITPIFKGDFNKFSYPVAEELGNMAYRANITSINHIGTINNNINTGHQYIEVFDVTIRDNANITRSRVGIQTFIREKLLNEYTHAFLIFHYENPKDRSWRFSYAYKYSKHNMTEAKRYTYLLGKNFSCRTVTERFLQLSKSNLGDADLLDAFSVEALSKEFFTKYKEQYLKFCQFLYDNRNNREYFGGEFAVWEDKKLRDYVKKMMGRITFIYFLQRKGWMNGELQYMNNAFNRSQYKDDYLDKFLEPLFFGVLNTASNDRPALFFKEGWENSLLKEWENVPYLNGGLFDKDVYDKPKSKFPAALFQELFDFYSQYNFTIDENAPDDAEVGVDPEMLGKIFENLLEDNKDKGAYYTPKEIVDYMCNESLIAYLQTDVDDNDKKQEIRDFVITHNKSSLVTVDINSIIQRLQNVKICDPAIGSGAFPMGMLNLLVKCREALEDNIESRVKLKTEIIQNNIFGVDLEQGAVDIARLRFWLSIVVDENMDAKDVPPLPNLDYKIMCGNSLLNRYGLDEPLKDVFKAYNKYKDEEEKMSFEKYKQMVDDYTNTSDHLAKERFKDTINDIKNVFRFQLSNEEINNINKVKRCIMDIEYPSFFDFTKQEKIIREKQLKELKTKLNKLEKERENIENNKLYEGAFEWRIEFPQLLDCNGNFIGFDIIIANPPFGAKLKKEEKEIYKEKFSDVHMRTPETFCYFISQALRLARNSGSIITYIVPNNMFFQNENQKTRELLAFKHQMLRAINLGDNTFENADVPTCIFVCKTGFASEYAIKYSDYRNYNVKNINWNKDTYKLSINLLKTVPSYVIGMSNENIDILNIIKDKGVTIDSIAEEMASGISTGDNKVFILPDETAKKYCLESVLLKDILVGSDIDRYKIVINNNVIIYTVRDMDIALYPQTERYLRTFYKKLSNRSECKKGVLPWFALGRSRYEMLFTAPKIIMRQTSDCIRAVYDENGYYVLNSILVLKKNTDEYDYKFISAVLNSTLTDYLYKNLTQEEGRIFAEVKPANVRKLYIPKATKKEQQLLSLLYDYMVSLNDKTMTEQVVTLSHLFINLFKELIDGCVYELFFREHMQERGIDIMSYLYDIIEPIEGLDEVDKINKIIEVHTKIFMTDNPVRTRLKLFVSRSPEYLKPIIQH